ncbi:Late secretory pathway protein AVL9-like protein [Fragariocoptes setiger]|uniref:Late secretory pathway protein AVL9-like protein n=1 Tax=Fragariocoptes setiger TaxID=1670756 RepID=A0ABQ7SCR5_9ACAR|nr:Late secretory pathway protein AVL9-like protein [Fragariocoptes setiger]
MDGTIGSEADPAPSTAADDLEPEVDYTECYNENNIIRHIMVIGFHHKHGYQVDYCYPPIAASPNRVVVSTPEKPIVLPNSWKTLPLLCLPDGAHNFDNDIIYFTVPDDKQPEPISRHSKDLQEDTEGGLSGDDKQESACSNDNIGVKTIFGTACYRQIQADKLVNKSSDITRISVQKSVCVLSKLPLFGLIRSKLEMITHAYFQELDFSKVSILKLTYDNLNASLSSDSIKDSTIFLGLSARALVSQFAYNLLVIFKAILLEKKILFYGSPVRDLCNTIMTVCSLFPGLLESGGLDYSGCDLQLTQAMLEALKLSDSSELRTVDLPVRDDKVFFSPSKEEVVIITDPNFGDSFIDISDKLSLNGEKEECCTSDLPVMVEQNTSSSDEKSELNHKDENPIETQTIGDETVLADGSVPEDPFVLKLCRMEPEETGLPLQVFTRGSFCLPYLSISYLDLLSDVRVKSFVIGATNFLFKQKKDMYDMIVDLEENKVEIIDANLKRYLSLTTEDLRFMDHLIRHVTVIANDNQSKNENPTTGLIGHDITKWVGGEEWIRYHFRMYTMYMLRAARVNNLEPFNARFMQAWKQTTNNYKQWESSGKAPVLMALKNRHPFTCSRGLNFADMKLKFSYNFSDHVTNVSSTFRSVFSNRSKAAGLETPGNQTRH